MWRKPSIITIVALFFISLFISFDAAAETRDISAYCKDPNYKCITVKRGQSWQSLFPDKTQRDIVMRVNRMNTGIWGGMKIAVPKNLAHITVLDVAPLPRNITPPGQKTILVYPSVHAWGAYDLYGNLVHWGPMSGGKSWCSDIKKSCHTVTGEFIIYDRRGQGCKSSKFPVGKGGAPMPYCMFFHGGFALHASKAVPGYNASHGCVRIFLDDAHWLNQNFIDMPTETTPPTVVIIKDYDEPVTDSM